MSESTNDLAKLNEAVARKLGYTSCSTHWHDKEHTEKIASKEWRDTCVCHDDFKSYDPDVDYCRAIPDFCESIEAAWEILAMLVAKGDNIRLENNDRSDYVDQEKDKGKWHCDIWTDKGPSCVCADTAPLAIAKAFLKLP